MTLRGQEFREDGSGNGKGDAARWSWETGSWEGKLFARGGEEEWEKFRKRFGRKGRGKRFGRGGRRKDANSWDDEFGISFRNFKRMTGKFRKA